jgi:hypothetical protein
VYFCITNYLLEVEIENRKMAENKNEKIIYSPAVIEFVTVCVEFCAFLEKDEIESRNEWLAKIIRILPLLYLKATLLPETVQLNDEPLETFVNEEDYARIETKVASLMGEEDVYLDVFVEDMKYSDTPVSASISEDIADIYQDIRNFVSVYQYHLTDQMIDALNRCVENFKTYWGQKLVNIMRPLHALYYGDDLFSDEENEEEDLNLDGLWD